MYYAIYCTRGCGRVADKARDEAEGFIKQRDHNPECNKLCNALLERTWYVVRCVGDRLILSEISEELCSLPRQPSY